MKKNESLIVKRENIFLKFIDKLKKTFKGLVPKRKNTKRMENLEAIQLRDMEILKDVVNGNLNLKELDNETKKRLINLCQKWSEEIHKKTEIINKKIKIAEDIARKIS